MIIIVLLIMAVLFFVFTGLNVCYKVVYPKMKSDEEVEKIRFDQSSYELDWFNSLEKKNFFIKSSFGYDVAATYIKNPKESENTIIICHGVTMRTEGVVKFLNMFLKRGYNALFIDHRAHGKSGGKKVSYGYYEKHDLAEAIKWVKQNYSGVIGLIGESMGSAISLQSLLVSKDVDFVVSDCGFVSFEEQVKHLIRVEKYVPVYPTYWFARFFIILFGTFDIEKASPLQAVKESDIPIMIVHGDEDIYVPFYMSNLLYDAIKHNGKKLYVAKGARHAMAYAVDPEEYDKQVREFLESNKLPF